MNQLSLSARPKTFASLIGRDKVITAIRGHMKSGRVVKAWLFTGPKGTGKTTIARILALALQCPHQTPDTFGTPCKECRRLKSKYSIREINASQVTGKDDIEKLLQGSDYGVMGDSKYNIYIFDECHSLSKAAQNLMLKYLEDTPETTIFILCSTEPHAIKDTIRRRCQIYNLTDLDPDDVIVYVAKLLKGNSDLPADRLADALCERGIRSPGLIAQAVEKYIAGLSPDDAANVDGATEVDTHALCRCVVKGDWPGVAKALREAEASNARGMRMGVLGYLRAILLDESEINDRTKVIASCVDALCSIHNAEDAVIAASLASNLYRVTALCAKYKH